MPIVPWHGAPVVTPPRSGCILISELAYGITLFAYCEPMQHIWFSLLYTMRKCSERVIYSSC